MRTAESDLVCRGIGFRNRILESDLGTVVGTVIRIDPIRGNQEERIG